MTSNQHLKNIFSRNLKHYLSIYNKTQADLVNDLNLTSSTVSDWATAKKFPRMDKIQMIADYLGIMKSDLIEDKQFKNKGIKIPILGSVIAGVPIEAIEEILGYEEISQDMAKTGEYFALRIKGESMEPKMSEGDIVIVKKQSMVENGQIAIVLVNGHEATVKKVRFRDNGIELIAFNSYVYEPHFYNAKEIQELPVQIIGRVVELRAKF